MLAQKYKSAAKAKLIADRISLAYIPRMWAWGVSRQLSMIAGIKAAIFQKEGNR